MKFHFALLFVLCALALARDENSMALKATATSTDAPLSDAVLLFNAKSTLFGNCITKANTRKMQYSSIEDEGISFVKYKVSKFAKGLSPLNWEREIQCNDIIDCARASKDYNMFQYNGQTCRMVNRTYADIRGGFCGEYEDYTKDIVYVNEQVRPTGCPAHTDVVDGTPLCLGVIRMDVPFDAKIAHASCNHHNMGPVYYQLDGVSFDTIRNIMRDKKYQGDFMVDTQYDGAYKWDRKNPVNESHFVVVPHDPYFQKRIAMSSSHDYLLVALDDRTKITGFICIGYSFG